MSFEDSAVKIMSIVIDGIKKKQCFYCEHINRYTMDACNLNNGNRTGQTDTCDKWQIEKSYSNLIEPSQEGNNVWASNK